MTPPSTGDAAQALLAARRDGAITALPAHAKPRDSTDAYAVQDEVARQLGPVGGWKVGAASNTAEPNCAPIQKARLYPSPHSVPAHESAMRGVEAEIAFRFGTSLAPRARPYELNEVTAAISGAMPAIEICESRFIDIASVDPLSLLADCNSNSALVWGADWPRWQALDALAQPVTLDIGAERVADQRGGNSAGEPFRLLVWLANHLAQRGPGLVAGDIVTTGSWTGLRCARAGDAVTAQFPGIGSVVAKFD